MELFYFVHCLIYISCKILHQVYADLWKKTCEKTNHAACLLVDSGNMSKKIFYVSESWYDREVLRAGNRR